MTEFEQRMATTLQTRDADKAEERKDNNKEEKNKKKEDEERYKQTLKLLRTLKMKIEAASSMHQASYPAMPCKEHGTTSYGLNTKHQHFRVIFDKKKPSKEKMLKWASSKPCQAEWIHALQLIDNHMNSL